MSKKKFSCVSVFFILCASVFSLSKPEKVIDIVPTQVPAVVEENKAEEKNEVVEVTPPVPYTKEEITGEAVSFKETWGYVMEGREYEFSASMPITDVGYFGVTVNTYGELDSVPRRSKLSSYNGRVHLVATCDSKSLTHFVLDPSLPLRDKLVKDLVKASENYDGLQIDYELVPARDAKNFLSFLKEIRKELGKDKIFSVALPARIKTISDDVYKYSEIVPLVDKIIIMAYDEHWSTSKPGSIASINWCRKIADYCVKVIPEDKLVMGLPFYGRTWGSFSTNKAYYYSGINRIMNENGISEISRENSVPFFEYKTEISITGYFEDVVSLVTRCRLYKEYDMKALAFWRIGQEDKDFWSWLKVED